MNLVCAFSRSRVVTCYEVVSTRVLYTDYSSIHTQDPFFTKYTHPQIYFLLSIISRDCMWLFLRLVSCARV